VKKDVSLCCILINNKKTTDMSNKPALSNLQLELLKMFAHQVSDEDLMAVRGMLVQYFAQKAIAEADAVWDEKGWATADTERLTNEHHRTPYTRISSSK
jgi:hypothetical protein